MAAAGCGTAGSPGADASTSSLSGDGPHVGPVVLITLGGLRADAVGPELTPHLSALMAEADWSGSAVASSVWALPSLGTLATGLDPWRHGLFLQGADERPSADFIGWERGFPALADTLAARGYSVSSYVSSGFLRGSGLAHRAMGQVRRLRGGGFARGHLRSLGEAEGEPRQLLWVQLAAPMGPYGGPTAGAGAQRAAYRRQVAAADARLGELLDALRAAPGWDDTLLLVTALHGAPVAAVGGTGAQEAVAGNDEWRLGRGLLEVPLTVRLPAGLRQRAPLAAPETAPVALGRVWSTVVEAVGGGVPPAAPRSLFRPVAGAALSELHLSRGRNEHSLVEPPDAVEEGPDSAAEGAADGAANGAADVGSGAGSATVAWQLLRAVPLSPHGGYLETRPFSGAGGAEPRTRLLRWRADGGVETVDDPARTAAMAHRLERRWRAFQDCERPPAAEAVHRRGQRAGGALPPAPGDRAAAPAVAEAPADADAGGAAEADRGR